MGKEQRADDSGQCGERRFWSGVNRFYNALVVLGSVVILYGSSGYRASVGGDPL